LSYSLIISLPDLSWDMPSDWKFRSWNCKNLGVRLSVGLSVTFLSFCLCTTLKIFRNAVCVYALILFPTYLLRKRVCIDSRNVNNKYWIIYTNGAKFAARRLCLVTETAHYVHIVWALRFPGVTAGYYLRLFAFYVQCLTVAGMDVHRNFSRGTKSTFCFSFSGC